MSWLQPTGSTNFQKLLHQQKKKIQPYNQSLSPATNIDATTLFYLCTNREVRHRPHKDTNPFCQLQLT